MRIALAVIIQVILVYTFFPATKESIPKLIGVIILLNIGFSLGFIMLVLIWAKITDFIEQNKND